MLQYTHPEEKVRFGDVIGELEDQVPEEEHDGGRVLVEKPCGDEIYPTDSDKENFFVAFSFLLASYSRAPKNNIVNPSLLLFYRKSTVCTFSNANLLENIHPPQIRKENLHPHERRNLDIIKCG